MAKRRRIEDYPSIQTTVCLFLFLLLLEHPRTIPDEVDDRGFDVDGDREDYAVEVVAAVAAVYLWGKVMKSRKSLLLSANEVRLLVPAESRSVGVAEVAAAAAAVPD